MEGLTFVKYRPRLPTNLSTVHSHIPSTPYRYNQHHVPKNVEGLIPAANNVDPESNARLDTPSLVKPGMALVKALPQEKLFQEPHDGKLAVLPAINI